MPFPLADIAISCSNNFIRTNTETMCRKFLDRLYRIDQLIQRRGTGTAQDLADRLEISRRTVLEYIAVMKERGAPIYFDRIKKSYCYSESGSFNISFITVQ